MGGGCLGNSHFLRPSLINASHLSHFFIITRLIIHYGKFHNSLQPFACSKLLTFLAPICLYGSHLPFFEFAGRYLNNLE